MYLEELFDIKLNPWEISAEEVFELGESGRPIVQTRVDVGQDLAGRCGTKKVTNRGAKLFSCVGRSNMFMLPLWFGPHQPLLVTVLIPSVLTLLNHHLLNSHLFDLLSAMF
jgi:hypothetical protein